MNIDIKQAISEGTSLDDLVKTLVDEYNAATAEKELVIQKQKDAKAIGEAMANYALSYYDNHYLYDLFANSNMEEVLEFIFKGFPNSQDRVVEDALDSVHELMKELGLWG